MNPRRLLSVLRTCPLLGWESSLLSGVFNTGRHGTKYLLSVYQDERMVCVIRLVLWEMTSKEPANVERYLNSGDKPPGLG